MTLVARRRSSSTMCSSARLAFDSSTVRDRRRIAPPECRARHTAARRCTAGCREAGIGSPKTAWRAGTAPRPAAGCPPAAPARGQQQAPDVDGDAVGTATASVISRRSVGLHLGGLLLGDHAPVELEQDLARHHVGVGAALDQADVQVRMGDARDRRSSLACSRVFWCVQRGQDQRWRPAAHRRRFGDGVRGHLAVHRDLELQAAVVRRHHLIAEAGGDQQSGLVKPCLSSQSGPSSPPNSSS